MIKKPLSPFVRNIVTVGLGTGAAQVVGFLSMMVVTRLYSTHEFSEFSIFASWLSVFELVVVGCLHMAIVAARSEEDVSSLRLGGYLVGALMIFPFVLLSFFDLGDFWVLRFLCLGLIAALIYQIEYGVGWRKNLYKKLTIARFLQTSSTGVIQIAGGFFSYGTVGLVAGSVIGYFFSAIALFSGRVRWGAIERQQAVASVVKYKNFPLFSMPSYVVATLGKMLPGFVLPLIGSLAELGFIFLAIKVLTLPIVLVGQSIGQVFYRKLSSENAEDSLVTFDKLLIRLFPLTVIAIVVLGFSGEFLFSVIFGEKWRAAGAYAVLLSCWFGSSFLLQPFLGIFDVFGRQKEIFLINSFLLVVQSLLFYFVYVIEKDLSYSVFAFSMGGLIVNLWALSRARAILSSQRV